MKPFSVQVKQEKRTGVKNQDSVSFIRHVDVVYMGNTYRLGKTSGGTFNLKINGIQQKQYFNGPVSFAKSGSNFLLTIDIGLKVLWDGNQVITVNLCNTYKGYVCGLCGNFDGEQAL